MGAAASLEWCEGSGTKGELSVCFRFLTVWFLVHKALIRREKNWYNLLGRLSPKTKRTRFRRRRRRPWWRGQAGRPRSTMGATSQSGARQPAGGSAAAPERCGRRTGPRGRRGRRVGARAAGGPGGAAHQRPTSRRPWQHPVCSGRGSRGRQHPRVSPEPLVEQRPPPREPSRTMLSCRARASETRRLPSPSSLILPAPPSLPSHPGPAQPPPFSRSFSNPQLLRQPLPER